MPREDATIKTHRYRDADGRPTCATNFKTGQACEFHCTTKFGTVDTCLFALTENAPRPRLERRDDGNGLLIPGDWCPLFKHN